MSCKKNFESVLLLDLTIIGADQKGKNIKTFTAID